MITLHSTCEHHRQPWRERERERCRLLSAVLSDYINHNRGHWGIVAVKATIMDCKWVWYRFIAIKHGHAEVHWWITLALAIQIAADTVPPASQPLQSLHVERSSERIQVTGDWLKWESLTVKQKATEVSMCLPQSADRTQSPKKCKGDTNSNGRIVVCFLPNCPRSGRCSVPSQFSCLSHFFLWWKRNCGPRPETDR